MSRVRCDWCLKNDIYKKYHDEVWGWPEHDDQRLFEKLCLDGAQAGLSWYTILIRTEGYRKAFDNWDAEKIVRYDQKKIDSLLQDKGIIRNKLKIHSVITNAHAFLEVQKEHGSFNDFLWKHVDHQPLVNEFKSMTDIPASTLLSDEVSKDLKNHGFKFVGSTIVYAFMQAVGIVDDHIDSCWRRTG
jgi:DNA-3-methyladenine glycosylase I